MYSFTLLFVQFRLPIIKIGIFIKNGKQKFPWKGQNGAIKFTIYMNEFILIFPVMI